jgi:hypothetical protein
MKSNFVFIAFHVPGKHQGSHAIKTKLDFMGVSEE